MKKLAVILSAALCATTMLYGCGKDEPAPEQSSLPIASSAGDEDKSAEKPSTMEEIVMHNLKIDPADISLIQIKTPPAGTPSATIKTSAGDIKMALFPDEAPKAVEQFTKLAKDGFYNGKSFYEILPSIRICAGDPAGKESYEAEYSLNLWHFNGAVAMEKGGSFYVVQNSSISNALSEEMLDGGFPDKVVNAYLKYGGVPNYDYNDTVFGQVVEGQNIVEKIASVSRDENNKPKEEITITAIELGTF